MALDQPTLSRETTLDPPPSQREAVARKSVVKGLVKLVRPHQWVKNLFVAAPMVFHKDLVQTSLTGDPTLNLRVAGEAILGTFVFCLLAGAVYTINDLVDVEADRIHPVKRTRPIASGQVPVKMAWPFAISLVVIALALGFGKLNWMFGAIATAYFVENVLYSFKLKKIAFFDVFMIALGFVLRVYAGGFATNVKVSWYMIACTFLLALFLGFGKRRHELKASGTRARSSLEAYDARTLTVALYVLGAATVPAYVLWTLDTFTVRFFGTHYLWLTTPFVVFGILMFIRLVRDEKRLESPTDEMIRNAPFMLNLVLWGVAILTIIYQLRPTQPGPGSQQQPALRVSSAPGAGP